MLRVVPPEVMVSTPESTTAVCPSASWSVTTNSPSPNTFSPNAKKSDSETSME
jgi:hypothetical protein